MGLKELRNCFEGQIRRKLKSDQNGIERRYLSTQIKVQIKNIQIVMS